MTQSKYIRDLLQKTNMLEAKPISSPMNSSCRLSKHGSDLLLDPSFYRSVVGALHYVTITHPELSFAVNKVCQFMASLESHWTAVKRILRYLKGALHARLILYPASLKNHLPLRGFCDSDWASDLDDRRSTSGAAVFVGPNLVSWWSRKQKAVSRSSTEAEYRSLVAATADILWIQTLLLELAVPHSIPIMLCDNSSALQLAHNPVLHARTKHMELNVFFVREKVLTKQLVVQHIPGTDQWEDLLTKPLSSTRFTYLSSKLNVAEL